MDMKVLSAPQIINIPKQNYAIKCENKSSKSHFSAHLKHPITFCGAVQVAETAKFFSAKKYLSDTLEKLIINKKPLNFSKLEYDKLEGIQEGIKVFQGLSMKEIVFIFNNFFAVAVNRGCANRCSHCYANAIPQHFKEDSDLVSKMEMEDLLSLTSGIKELNKRLGFNVIKNNKSRYNTLFHDSDCIDIELRDSKGKIYDFTALNDLLYDSTKKAGIFDTSGWTPKNLKHQQRAEKIVEYFLDNENMKKVVGINLSLNPYHGLNERAIRHMSSGNHDSAKKFRDFYVERIANAIFTFTPLLRKEKFAFLARVIDAEEVPKGYEKKDLESLMEEIFAKVEKKYEEDYLGEQKYIRVPFQISNNMKYISQKAKSIEYVEPHGRAREIFARNNFLLALSEITHKNFVEKFQYVKNRPNGKMGDINSCIDVNGKIYVTDFGLTVPTELQLNFKNKNKNTIPMGDFYPDGLITKEAVNKLYSSVE